MKIIKNNIKDTKKAIFSIALVILIFAGAFFVVNNAKISIGDTSIEVSSLYSVTLNYNDVEEVKLEDSLPSNLKRINGIDLFGTYLGNFKADNMEKLKIFLKSRKGPFIYIKTRNDEYVIINTNNKENTEVLYKEINSKISS